MSTNATISFFPTREPVDPVPDPEVEYSIDVTMTQFDRSVEAGTRRTQSLSGLRQTSLYYSTDAFACEINPFNVGAASEAEARMFFASVRAGEEFTVSNFDESDRAMVCTLAGRESPQRANAADSGRFIYSFAVREVPA